MFKLKHIVIAQAVLIVLLFIVVIKLSFSLPKSNGTSDGPDWAKQGFLSSRVYAGIVRPHSFAVMNFVPLRVTLEKFLADNKLHISVYVENLKTGTNFGINERKEYMPASLTKVLVAVLVLRQVEKGKITLDTMLEITPADRLDTAGSLFMSPEQSLPVRDLLKAMLSESDNTALRILNRYTDQEDRATIVKYVGYHSAADIGKKEIDDDPEKEFISPKAVYNLFSSLYLSTLLKPENSEFILSALVNTDFDIDGKAKLPEDVIVAHKFGSRYTEQTRCFHDCGIMYIYSKDMRFFYCIMTEGLEGQKAMDAIGRIVGAIYSYGIGFRTKFDRYRDEWHAS